MLSTEVHRWLEAVEAGEAVDPSALATLVDRRWVERVETGGDSAQLEGLRAELRAVQAIRADAAGDPERRAMLEEATRREREVRMAILDLSEAAARGDRPWALTWRGRELLGELRPRLGRLEGVDVDGFEVGMTELAYDLTTLAARAAEVAPRLGRSGSGAAGVAPVTLRSVAIGLATFTAGPDAAVNAWNDALNKLPSAEIAPDTRATLAEALVAHHPDGVDRIALSGLWGDLSRGGHYEDAASVISVVGVGPKVPELLREAQAVRDALGSLDRVGAVLLAVGGTGLVAAGPHAGTRGTGLVEEARRVSEAMVGALPDATRGRVIALVALAPGDADLALARFHGIRRWLAGFVGDDAVLSAATLCLLWAGPDEILDDLRIAAEVVERSGLGVGGVGSLALGARLLLTAGGTAPRGLLPVVATGQGRVVSRRLLPVTGTFHHDSLHRAALLAWHAERVRQLHAHHHGG